MRRRYMRNVLSRRPPSSDRTAGDAVHNCSHIARPLLLATIALSTGFAGAEARIESFSPTGHSKSVRQVAVRFSEPMVALGDPSRTDPFGIDCEVPGRGRWVDERNWVYDFDRPLANASNFPATIRVGRLPPGANFGRAPIVVEYDEDATAPVLLRRIAQPLAGSRLRIGRDDAEIVAWMRKVAGAWNAEPDTWRGLASSRPLFGPDDKPQRFALPVNPSDEPFQFASVPLAGRGFHVLQLDLPASADFPARYVAGMAVATDLAVHFHRAEESTLAWVTRLADGRPVDGAEVRVSAACTGRMLARGATDADGIARIPTALAWVDDCAGFRYLVTARKDGDLALATFGLPRDTEPWEVTARSGSAVDRLATWQLVEPIVPVRVQQAILTQLATLRELPVKPPAKALPGRGGIRVSLQPSLAGSLHTVQEAVARYRYTCLEQKVSAAIVLEDPERWSAAMAFARTSLDGDGLLRFFPSASLSGSPILTAYVLAIADAAGNAIPDDLRDAMIEGLEEYVAGRIARVGVLGAADSHLRRLSALAALAGYDALDDDMLATVTEHQLEVLPTSALLDLIDILKHLDPDRSELAFAKATLRSRLSLQGTTMGFSTENRDRLWWLMVSTDGNAARSILSLMDDAEWEQDLPRMMRGLFGRQQRGRWQTTVANAWGTVAAAKFATSFEPVAVTGASVVRLGEERRRAAWPNRDDRTASADAPPPIQLPWSAAQVLSLAHEGTGAPWGLVELRAAVPLTQPVSRGYRIVRRMEPVDPAKRRAWARGGVAQIILDIDATADMTWVVVEDPLPPGTVVLGSGLGGDSSLLAARYKSVDRCPVFTERDVDSYRAYYRYVPKGRTTLRYNVRYNTAGRFQLPPTRVEAMYAPEMHAEMPLKPITIR